MAIVTLTGDSGILQKVVESKNNSIEAEEQELIKLGYNEYEINKHIEQEAQLKVEGANTSENEYGWDIKFNKTGNEYTLSSNGIIDKTDPEGDFEKLKKYFIGYSLESLAEFSDEGIRFINNERMSDASRITINENYYIGGIIDPIEGTYSDAGCITYKGHDYWVGLAYDDDQTVVYLKKRPYIETNLDQLVIGLNISDFYDNENNEFIPNIMLMEWYYDEDAELLSNDENSNVFKFIYGDYGYVIRYDETGKITECDKMDKIAAKMELQPDNGKTELILEFYVSSGGGSWIDIRTNSGLGQQGTIDWGDGSVNTFSDNTSYLAHTYYRSEVNRLYDVKITGTFKEIHFLSEYSHTLRKVKQWGTVGLETVWFNNCNRLTEIAEPTENSFKELRRMAFIECNRLNSIPERLLSNAPNLTNFSQMFQECTGLTNIPKNLLYNCNNITSCHWMFKGCTNLTGEAIPLWKRVENGENNDYIGTPDGKNCYKGCTLLTNYNEIPTYWKEEPEEVIV